MIAKAQRLMLALAAASLLAGCVTEGRDFPSRLDWLKDGKTKEADVHMVLGDPYMVGSSSGTPTWTYGYYKYHLIGDRHSKELKLYWNPDKTLRDYSFTSNFPDDTLMSRVQPDATRSH